MDEQVKQLLSEIEQLVDQATSDGEELDPELLARFDEIAVQATLLKDKRQLDNSQDQTNKLDTLIKVITEGDKLSTESTKTLAEAIKQIKVEAPQVNVAPPKVEVQVPEIKVPLIPPPEVNVPPTIVNMPEEISVKKPSWIESIVDLNPILSVLRALQGHIEAFKFPVDPKNPISVRLSNGEKFYNALGGVTSAISGMFPFKRADATDQAARVNDDGVQYTFIQETVPTASTKVNALVELGMNSGGTLVRIRKTIDGVIYEKTFSDADMVVVTTRTLSKWTQV